MLTLFPVKPGLLLIVLCIFYLTSCGSKINPRDITGLEASSTNLVSRFASGVSCLKISATPNKLQYSNDELDCVEPSEFMIAGTTYRVDVENFYNSIFGSIVNASGLNCICGCALEDYAKEVPKIHNIVKQLNGVYQIGSSCYKDPDGRKTCSSGQPGYTKLGRSYFLRDLLPLLKLAVPEAFDNSEISLALIQEYITSK